MGSATRKSPSILGQLATCAVLSLLATAITLIFQGPPAFHRWRTGQSFAAQAGVLVGFAMLSWAGLIVAFQLTFFRRRFRLPAALATLDVSGYKPWIIGMAAGVGEELLFRAALLPLLGLLASSILFGLAHVRTALFAATWMQRIGYVANAVVAGVILGVVFNRVGLPAAIGIHAMIDIAALSAMRRLQTTPSAARRIADSR